MRTTRPCHVRDGHRVLRGRQQRDWRLAIVDLHGVGLMRGRAGAASIYSAAGSAGLFSFLIPLTRHDQLLIDGHRFDRQTIAWLAPGRVFHIDSRQPASWLSVTISKELLMSWFASHEDEGDPVLLNRNLRGVREPADCRVDSPDAAVVPGGCAMSGRAVRPCRRERGAGGNPRRDPAHAPAREIRQGRRSSCDSSSAGPRPCAGLDEVDGR